jgi:hypothetical protein
MRTCEGDGQGRVQGRRRGRAEKKKGEGRGRKRGRGELTSGFKSGDHCLQNLGHHGGERERWRRGGCCAEKSNERKGEKGAGRMGRGRAPRARGPERAGLGRAGLGHTVGQNHAARTTADGNPIREKKTETRLGKHAIKHDIGQKKYDSA